jgi:hypothetical protein
MLMAQGLLRFTSQLVSTLARVAQDDSAFSQYFAPMK